MKKCCIDSIKSMWKIICPVCREYKGTIVRTKKSHCVYCDLTWTHLKFKK